MFQIALAKKTEYRPGQEENSGQIVVEPLFPGYGMTLGNSLRRVLLSSLTGAAPIGVKIEGVDHEFMALPHLKEDILQVVLTLKKLRVRVHSDEVEKLVIEVHGEKIVSAADFKKNASVDILNPDLVIGTITDMSGSFKAELYVARGMGYEMIENREHKSTEIGYIEMDSIFTPVLKCGLNVENVRVGKMTNWERLILDVTSDGSISPEEAFAQSVQILIEQFAALGGNPDGRAEEEARQAEAKAEEAKAELAQEDSQKEATDGKGEVNDEEEDLEDKPKRGRPKKS